MSSVAKVVVKGMTSSFQFFGNELVSVIYSIRCFSICINGQAASPPIKHHPVTYCSYHMLQDPITGLIQDVTYAVQIVATCFYSSFTYNSRAIHIQTIQHVCPIVFIN